MLFIIGDWNAKVGSQEIPGVTGKFGLGVQNEVDQRLTVFLPREYTGHSKYCLPTIQEMTLHIEHHQMVYNQNQIDYILCNQRWRSSAQSGKNKTGI